MRVLSVLFILTSIEAKRRRLDNDRVDVSRRIKTNNVEVYPERFSGAVDFGHVYKDDRKQMTQMAPDMGEPRSPEHARQILRKLGSDLGNLEKPVVPQGFSSPRDAILYNERMRPAKNNHKNGTIESNYRPLRRKNLTQGIRKSVEDEINKKYPVSRVTTPRHPTPDDIPFEKDPEDGNDHKEKFFSKQGFDLVSNDETHRLNNWTTCKEFAKGAVFHPDDVVNLQWVPFYIWSTGRFVTSVVHTLAYPTKKLVKQYKEQFGPYLNVQLDWEQPKLILKGSIDMLLIAGDRKGLFYGIPYIELPSPVKNYKIKLTVVVVRLKIIDPYLAMMYCNDKYASIMSLSGSEPETDEEKTAEASILKFRGTGNPAGRDLELEARKSKYEIEMKRRQEAQKYIYVERPEDELDPSLW